MSKQPLPMRCVWTGEAFVPQGRGLNYAREEFGEGEIVMLERNEERSDASHSHYFASLNEAWQNLPERLASEYPTVEALRAKALIETGFCTERTLVLDTAKDAATVAAWIGQEHPFAVVVVKKNVLRVYIAKSQSRKAMNKKEFAASKDAVLNFVAQLIPVTRDELDKSSHAHA